MSRNVEIPAENVVTVTGTLLDITFRDGVSAAAKGSKPYRSAEARIRVEQSYGPEGARKEEVSEIPVKFMAMKFKKDGTSNPIYEQIGEFVNLRTAKQVGLAAASRVRVGGAKNANLRENLFAASRDPENVRSVWEINATYMDECRASEDSLSKNANCATFSVLATIGSIANEVNSEGEETGRLRMTAGIVQYGRKIDLFTFFVENPSAVDYISRNYQVNDTVHLMGRIRMTSEVEEIVSQDSWGEDIPQTSTKKKTELIVTKGDDYALEGDMAYSIEELQPLFADRAARKEAAKIEARNRATRISPSSPTAAATRATTSKPFAWE